MRRGQTLVEFAIIASAIVSLIFLVGASIGASAGMMYGIEFLAKFSEGIRHPGTTIPVVAVEAKMGGRKVTLPGFLLSWAPEDATPRYQNVFELFYDNVIQEFSATFVDIPGIYTLTLSVKRQ